MYLFRCKIKCNAIFNLFLSYICSAVYLHPFLVFNNKNKNSYIEIINIVINKKILEEKKEHF